MVKGFKVYTNNARKYLNNIYYCYSCFVNIISLKYIFDKYLVIMTVFDINILRQNNLDCCGHLFKSFNFCESIEIK